MKKRKYLFIQTAVTYEKDKCITFPIGIMHLSSVLKKHTKSNIDIRIIDIRLSDIKTSEIIKKISKFSPDIICFSTFSQEEVNLIEISKEIYNSFPDLIQTCGGPYATSTPKRALDNAKLDVVAISEGENTIIELYDLFESVDYKKNNLQSNCNKLNKINGIAYYNKSEYIETKPREFIQDLDSLPYPDWELIKFHEYYKKIHFSRIYNSKRYMSIITSRGCPYKCLYCHNIFGKKIRFRSPENIFSEIRILHDRYGVRDIEIIDDSFNLDKERLLEFCRLIKNSNMKLSFRFPNGLRGDVLDKIQLDNLKDIGTIFISYAIETGSNRLQKLIKKNMNLDKLKKNIAYTNKLGIFTNGFFMIGFPTETKEELLKTIRYANSTKLNSAVYFIVNIYENSPLLNLLDKDKRENIKIDYKKLDYEFCQYNFSNIDNKTFRRLRTIGFFSFYVNPNRILDLFSNIPKLSIFFRLFYNSTPVLILRERLGLI